MRKPEFFPVGHKPHSPTFSERLQAGIERRRKESKTTEELRKLARTDKLTGLANRRVFDERLQEIKISRKRRPRSPGEKRSEDSESSAESAYRRTSNPVTIIMFDIDNFKKFNLEYGHSVGDLVLREIGALFTGTGTERKIVTRSGDLVARYGGEEFVLIVNGPLERGLGLAERIRDAIAKLHLVHGGMPMSLTASFGVASTEENDDELDRAVENADLALSNAKAEGKNRVVSLHQRNK